MNATIESAKTKATQARDASVAADHARRKGAPDRETALRLEDDFVAAASAADFHEAAYRALVAAEVGT